MRAGAVGGLAMLVAALVGACSSAPDAAPAPTATATATPATATTAALPVGPPAPAPAPPTTVAAAPAPPPVLRIEDAAVEVGAVWPVELGIAGPTRIASLVVGTGDAPPDDGAVLPPTPDVPHGYRSASAGPYTARVTAYDFGDTAAAASWAGEWIRFGERPPIERHDGRTLLQTTPVPDDGSGWSGLVLDRIEQPGEVQTWTRSIVLVRAVDARASRVEVSWSGRAGDEVPDLAPAARALAAAQDAHVGALPAGVDPLADVATRLAPLETLLGWRALLAEPGAAPPRRWAEQTTASTTAMPAGAAGDGAVLYAERYLVGDDGRPIVAAALTFAAPEAAGAAVARWGAAGDGLGPFTYAGFGVADDTGVGPVTTSGVDDVPAATVASVEVEVGDRVVAVAAAWYAAGARAYAIVAPDVDAATRLVRQQAALTASLTPVL